MPLNPLTLYRQIRRDSADKQALGDPTNLPEDLRKNREGMSSRIIKNGVVLGTEVLLSIAAIAMAVHFAMQHTEVEENPGAPPFTEIVEKYKRELSGVGVRDKDVALYIQEGVKNSLQENANSAAVHLIYRQTISFLRANVERARFKNNSKAKELLEFLDSFARLQLYTVETSTSAEPKWHIIPTPLEPREINLAVVSDYYDGEDRSAELYHWMAVTSAPHYDPKASSIFFSPKPGLNQNATMMHLLIAASDARSHKQTGEVDYTDSTWAEAAECTDKKSRHVSHSLGDTTCGIWIFSTTFLSSFPEGTTTVKQILTHLDDVAAKGAQTPERQQSLHYILVRRLLADKDAGVKETIAPMKDALIQIAKNPSLITEHFSGSSK